MQVEKKIFYGWWVVLAVTLIAFAASMGRYILTALFPFIQTDTHWTRKAIGFAFTCHFWVYALGSLLAGRLVDTWGGRKALLMGGAILMAGLLFLSRVTALWQLFLVYGIVIGLGVSLSFFVPNISLVRKWFARKAGLASGIMMTGISIGFALLVPLFTYMAGCWGWRQTAVIGGLGIGLLIILFAGIIVRNTPESMGLLPDGEPVASHNGGSNREEKREPRELTLRQSLCTPTFWFLFFAYSIMGISIQGFLTNAIMWGVDLGFNPAKAGIIMILVGLPSTSIRVLGGWLGDFFGKRRVLIYFNLFTAIIWLYGWVSVVSPRGMLFFAILIGFAYTAPFVLFTPYLGDLFGRSNIGTLSGILTMGHGLIGGLGPVIWGSIADSTGSYSLCCPLSALIYILMTLSVYLSRSELTNEDFRREY